MSPREIESFIRSQIKASLSSCCLCLAEVSLRFRAVSFFPFICVSHSTSVKVKVTQRRKDVRKSKYTQREKSFFRAAVTLPQAPSDVRSRGDDEERRAEDRILVLIGG